VIGILILLPETKTSVCLPMTINEAESIRSISSQSKAKAI